MKETLMNDAILKNTGTSTIKDVILGIRVANHRVVAGRVDTKGNTRHITLLVIIVIHRWCNQS